MNAETFLGLILAAPIVLGTVLIGIDHIRSTIELSAIKRRRANERVARILAEADEDLAKLIAENDKQTLQFRALGLTK